MKTCSKCGIVQPLMAFHRDTKTLDGHSCYCKRCACERARAWRLANPERHRATKELCRERKRADYAATQARYHRDHQEQVRQTQKRYRDRNRERLREAGRQRYHRHAKEWCAKSAQYRAMHAEAVAQRHAQYREKHPEIYRVASRGRRARKRAINEVFTVAMEQFLYKFWGCCAVCGTRDRLSVDHWLPLSLGHALALENAVLLCGSCNSKKSARLPEAVYTPEFVKVVEQRLHRQARQWSSLVGAV